MMWTWNMHFQRVEGQCWLEKYVGYVGGPDSMHGTAWFPSTLKIGPQTKEKDVTNKTIVEK